jgi:hypothetical protein
LPIAQHSIATIATSRLIPLTTTSLRHFYDEL